MASAVASSHQSSSWILQLFCIGNSLAGLLLRDGRIISGDLQELRLSVLGRKLQIFPPALFIVIRFDDIAHDRTCRRPPMLAAALDDGRNHNLRVAARRVSY